MASDGIIYSRRITIDRSRYVKSYECWYCKQPIKTGTDVMLLTDENHRNGFHDQFYEYVHLDCYTALLVSKRLMNAHQG